MRRRLLIVLLALGTFGGYASGFASIARHRRHCHAGGWAERWDSRGPWGNSPTFHSAAPAQPESPSSSTAQAPAPGPR
ncbi:hypothetical protein HUA76_15890 [Myxococcus sp. CA056]|uniref:hypothetical protein n=1 Tax=Myxococcus sp. CA056 TaxID=2741740 RepID=UPI00157B28E3|nr:hypothetical protein [Myxococcus sp. CA056]NTX12280.1 hypothetical protein [Myxococcus sp. CA056]